MAIDLDKIKQWVETGFIPDGEIFALIERCRSAEVEVDRLKLELSKHQESKFHPDWSMLAATRESLWEQIMHSPPPDEEQK